MFNTVFQKYKCPQPNIFRRKNIWCLKNPFYKFRRIRGNKICPEPQCPIKYEMITGVSKRRFWSYDFLPQSLQRYFVGFLLSKIPPVGEKSYRSFDNGKIFPFRPKAERNIKLLTLISHFLISCQCNWVVLEEYLTSGKCIGIMSYLWNVFAFFFQFIYFINCSTNIIKYSCKLTLNADQYSRNTKVISSYILWKT